MSNTVELLLGELAKKSFEIDELRALAEHQRIVIEHLFNVIEAAGLMLAEAYKQAQSQSTQTGSNDK